MSAKEERRQFIVPEDLKKIPVNRDVAISLLKYVIGNQDNPIITYGDLVKKLPFDYNPRNLDKPLGVISSACLEKDLPPISSIVVNKDTQLPGEGFYKEFYAKVNWQRDMQKIFEENKLAITNCTIWKDFLEEIEEEKLIKMKDINSILMPVNQKFLEVFEIFMDENQKTKIRANNVRQYIEGVIDLLLMENIQQHLGENEPYEGINWSRKLKIIKENYDENIAEKFQEIFRIGGDGSHFNGFVSGQELKKIISLAIHIVEDIFVKYFLTPEHQFGSENIYTIFSMLPLSNRIYILENVYAHYKNQEIVDRLSLAYFKNEEEDKARKLLEVAKEENVISSEFERMQLYKLNVLANNLSDLYAINSRYVDNPEYSKAIIDGDLLVVGLPTSKDVFETSKAVETFQQWFENGKNKYPEFINLFLCLMATDSRQYV